MDDFYKKMKTDIGIDPNYAVDQEDPKLDAALQKLRPNSSITSFRQYITKQYH